MSLPRYPEYKDSGVTWLGQMPSHWSLQRYKQVFVEREERSAEGAETLLSVSAYTGVSPRSEIIEDGDHLSRAESLEGYKVCYPDDLVMNIMLAWNRGLGFSAYHGIVSPAYSVFKPQGDNNPRFLDYMVRSDQVTLYYKAFSAGVIESRLRLYPDTFGSLYCALPPQDEQTAIAAFLDRETAKIDALIAEQEKLITLLAEKRQVTISHAVTRGLNPDAPMKDSGVAWLGEVPAHWEVKKLRYVATIVRGASPRPAGDPQFFASDNDSGANCPWVTVAEVTKDESLYLTDVAEYLTPAGVENSQSFQAGTLIFTNSGATLGVPKILAIDCCANDGILAFRQLSNAVDIRFLYFFLLTTTERLRTEMKQGGGQPNLNTGIVKEISFAAAPVAEQRSIVEFAEEELGRLGGLTTEAERAVELLKERRSALIAAAVTGQIDVRGQPHVPSGANA